MQIKTRRSCTYPKPPAGTISLVARCTYDLDDDLAGAMLLAGDAVPLDAIGLTIDPETLEPYPAPSEASPVEG